MSKVAFILLDHGLKSALDINFMFIVIVTIHKFFSGSGALVVEMLPDGFSCRPGVNYVLGRRSLEDRSSFVLLVRVRVFVVLALLMVVGVGGTAVGAGQRVSVDLAIGLEVLLLIKVHSNYYQV